MDADVHSLTVHLAGTFTPTPEMNDDARRAGALAAGLVERAQAAGCLRRDVVPADLDLVLEGCAAIRLPDPARTGELRRRYLRLLLDGLAASPGAAPRPAPPRPAARRGAELALAASLRRWRAASLVVGVLAGNTRWVTRSPCTQTVGSPSGTSSSDDVPEKRASRPHHHRHQVDRDLVEQPELQALPGHRARGDRHHAVPGDLLRPRDRRLDPAGDKMERSARMRRDPARGHLVSDDDDRHVMVCRPPHPSVKSKSVRPQTSAPSPETQRPQYSALCGLRWNVMPSVAVGTSTSPFWYQSNNRPIVLSSFAM